MCGVCMYAFLKLKRRKQKAAPGYPIYHYWHEIGGPPVGTGLIPFSSNETLRSLEINVIWQKNSSLVEVTV